MLIEDGEVAVTNERSASFEAFAFEIQGENVHFRIAGRIFGNSDSSQGIARVAVGTVLTNRPPHRSVRARLRIRLL
jgi:hypothetical protein